MSNDDQTLPRSVPTLILETDFFSTIEAHDLEHHGGLEAIALYQKLLCNCLRNTSHYEALKAGDIAPVAKFLMITKRRLQSFLTHLVMSKLAENLTDGGIKIYKIEERLAEFSRICTKNRRNACKKYIVSTELSNGNNSNVVVPVASHSPAKLTTEQLTTNNTQPFGKSETILAEVPIRFPPRAPSKVKTSAQVEEEIGESGMEIIKMEANRRGLSPPDIATALTIVGAWLAENPGRNAEAAVLQWGLTRAADAKKSQTDAETAQKRLANVATVPRKPGKDPNWQPLEPMSDEELRKLPEFQDVASKIHGRSAR